LFIAMMGCLTLTRRIARGAILLGLWLASIPPTMAQAADPGRLRVITDDNYPPYLYRNDKGEVSGYLVDYWKLWEGKTGVPVSLVATRWDEVQKRVLAGEADVIDMIFKTPIREALYDFTAPYADLPVNLYTHKSITGITEVDNLQGSQVGVRSGDSCAEELARHGIRNQVGFPDYAQLIAAAHRQDIKLFCMDQYPADFYLHKLGLQGEFRKTFTFYTGQFRRAAPKGQSETLRLVERGMASINEEELHKLADKWFGASLPEHTHPVSRPVLVILLSLAVGGGLVVIWVFFLRRQVAARTQDLRQANEVLNEERTALLRSEQLLDTSQAQLHLALESAGAGTWYWDVASNGNAWSDEVWRLYGLDREQPASYESWKSSIDERDVQATEVAVTQAVAANIGFEITWRVRNISPAHPRWLLARGKPLFDGDGRLTSYIGIVMDITQRKVDEAVLSKSELRYRTLVEGASVVTWSCPPSGLHVEPQPDWMAFTGQTAEEMLGSGWTKAVHPDDLAVAAANWNEAVATRKPFTSEHRIRRNDGQWRWMSVHAVPIRDASGEYSEWFGVNMDITERKASEVALKAVAADLEEAQRVGKIGSWSLDITENIVRWSDELFRIFEISPAEFGASYESFLERVHPDDRALVLGTNEQARLTGESFDIEYRIVTPSGAIKFISEIGNATKDAFDRVVRLFGIATDITTRKVAERARYESEQRFHDIVEASADWIWEVDAAGRYTYVSDTVEKVLGYRPDELLGLTPFDHMPEDEAARVAGAFTAFAAERKPFRDMENVNRHKHGRLLYIQSTGIPILAQDGTLLGYRGLDRDVTKRTLAEEALRQRETVMRAIFTQAGDAIELGDMETFWFVEFNEAACRLLGYTPEEYARMTIFDIQADRSEADIRALAANVPVGQSVQFENRHRRKDGSVIDVEVKVRMVEIQGHRYTVGVWRDISERKLTLQRLADSEQRLRLATSAAKMGVWEYDFASDRLFWSPEIYSIFGAQLVEPSRALLESLQHPDDRGISENAMQQAITSRTAYACQYRLIIEGETKWVEDHGTIHYAPDGRPVRVVGLAQDITARKLAETALQRSEARLRTLVETLPDLVWLKDPDGVFLACNRRFEALYGHAEADILGKTDYDFVDRDLADFFRANDRAAAAAGGPTANEEELIFANDGHRELLMTIKTPVFDAEGSLIGVLGVARDITQLRENERELETHRQHLEELVEARTAELTELAARMRESEERFRAVANAAPVLIWMAGIDNMCFFFNQTWRDFTGRSLEQEMGVGARLKVPRPAR
jgi:PAS domain S-box-containing protein